MSEQPQIPNFNDQQRSNNQKPKKNFSWLFYAILFFFIGLLLFPSDKFGSSKDISYTKLVKYIEEDLIESLSVSDENAVKATVRKDKEIIVFGPTTQEKSLFNPSERTVTSQIGSTDEFVKLMDKINAEPSIAVSAFAVFAKKVASMSELPPMNTAFRVPRTASFANAPLTNAMKVCQPMPKKRVTGSMNVPTR